MARPNDGELAEVPVDAFHANERKSLPWVDKKQDLSAIGRHVLLGDWAGTERDGMNWKSDWR